MKSKKGKSIRILAVCTGNICRSPMAEGILRSLLGETGAIDISSAGTHALPGNPASEFALITASEQGIDISGHRARVLDEGLIRNNTMILCMEPVHIEWILSLDRSSGRSVYSLPAFSKNGRLKKIPDPYGSSLREYRKCFASIRECVDRFIHAMIQEGSLPHSAVKKT